MIGQDCLTNVGYVCANLKHQPKRQLENGLKTRHCSNCCNLSLVFMSWWQPDLLWFGEGSVRGLGPNSGTQTRSQWVWKWYQSYAHNPPTSGETLEFDGSMPWIPLKSFEPPREKSFLEPISSHFFWTLRSYFWVIENVISGSGLGGSTAFHKASAAFNYKFLFSSAVLIRIWALRRSTFLKCCFLRACSVHFIFPACTRVL